MTFSQRFKPAVRAAAWHLLGSLMVASLVAVLVFGVFYPYPYRELAGGMALFGLVCAVDVVCGPLLTLVLFSPKKPRQELMRDLGMVAVIQLAALGYGLWTVALARPVHVVFEVDRFRLVTASEIDPMELLQAPEGLRQLPWMGTPTWLSTRAPRDNSEFLKSIDLSMAGKEPSLRPDWWQDYALALPQVLQRARPLSMLAEARSAQKDLIDAAVRKSGASESELVWLPLTSARATDWVVLLDKKTGQPRSYAHIDGFF